MIRIYFHNIWIIRCVDVDIVSVLALVEITSAQWIWRRYYDTRTRFCVLRQAVATRSAGRAHIRRLSESATVRSEAYLCAYLLALRSVYELSAAL